MTGPAFRAITYDSWRTTHGGSVMPLSDVCDRFSQFSLETVVGVLQRAELLLWHAGRPDSEVQNRIGLGLFEPVEWQELLSKVPRTVDGSAGQTRSFFFFSQQILNAAKVALLVCPDSQSKEPSLAVLGEALIGLTDHLDPKAPGGDSSLSPEELRHHVTLNAVFNQAERQLTLLPLGARLYLDSHDALRSHPQYVDFNELIVEAGGSARETATPTATPCRVAERLMAPSHCVISLSEVGTAGFEPATP